MEYINMFVVIEGIDRCGKTTLQEKLAKILGATILNFPMRDTPSGRVIDKYLRGELEVENINQLFVENRIEAQDLLKKFAGKSDNLLIVSRYYLSGAVFGHITSSTGDGEEAKKDQISPDLTLLIDVPAEDLIGRANYGDERYEKVEIQKKARELFLNLIARGGDEHVILDGRKDPNQILGDALKAIKNLYH